MREVITWDESLTESCEKVSVEEGEKIATELLEILTIRKDGIGLASNQVGIDASVAVLNIKEPVVLINPKIVKKTDETPYYEGCLSFPGKGCHTKRYETIEVTSENVEGSMIFSGVDTGESGKGSWAPDWPR